MAGFREYDGVKLMEKISHFCKITALDYGEEQGLTNLFFADKPSESFVFPIPGFYIETAAGIKVLFDTGCSPDYKQTWGLLNDFLPYVRERFMVDALKELKLAPGDIDYVVMSHLHYDHAGGLSSFRGTKAKIVVQKAEVQTVMAAVYTNRNDLAYAGYLGTDFQFTDLNWMVIDGDYDLLPGIHLILLPGHSAGEMGALIETKNTGDVILASDAIYTAENYGPPAKLPGAIYNLDDFNQSIEKVRRIAGMYNAKVLFGHDATQKMPVFPAWWD
jgi:glyoxylase-like metal-dependent hydrolase (beta-lactamase superfamily II)